MIPFALRVNQSVRRRLRTGYLMMVENDHGHASLFQPIDGFDRGGATVHCEQKLGGKLTQTIFDTFLTQAVSLIESIRKIRAQFPSESLQHFSQQRSRCDSVNIVIAKNHERLGVLARAKKTIDGPFHIREEKGISQVLQARFEKGIDRHRIAQPAV